ncbi:hypothetical protein EYR38_010762 [Pleurotus pulmonarius]|nr:hypothetical protein EYR38_010762 [Pleurotus pulmonarius]
MKDLTTILLEETVLPNLQGDIGELERSDNLDEDQASELGCLQKQRDASLRDYLEQCLDAVLPVANAESIRKLLSKYLTPFSGVETDRYAPYVNLCNPALASSKKLCLGFNKDGMALRKESFNTKNFDGRVQCAAFALEMLSQNPGIQHTINLLHVGLDDKRKYELQKMFLADSEAPSPKLEDPMKGRQDPRPSSTPPTHPSSVRWIGYRFEALARLRLCRY